MTNREYLKVETSQSTIVIKAQDKKIYRHTVNTYSSGLFLGQTPEYLNTTVNTKYPVMVPEETSITINAVANNNHTPIKVNVRNTKQSANIIRPYIVDVTVNFKSRIGIALLDVECGTEKFTLVLDVCPTKISYDDEYYSIVSDLQVISRALAFDWLRSSSFAGKQSGDRSTDLEFLNTLNSYIDQLAGCLRVIAQSPSRTIQNRLAPRRIDRINDHSQSIMRAVAQGKGTGPILPLGNGINAHERIPSYKAEVSYDTPANRWLKQKLVTTKARVTHVLRNNDNCDSNKVYTQETNEHLLELYAELTALQKKRFLQGVKSINSWNKPGIEVTRQPGYQTAAAIFDKLDMAFAISSGIQLINSRMIAELYEEWCYLKVATVVSELTNGNLDPRDAISVTNGNLRLRLNKNEQSRITIDCNDNGTFQIVYNKQYSTITGVQKPDIIIEINRRYLPGTILVLDAKYRLVDRDSYGNSIPPQPPVDAINALHRYRDAIYLTLRDRKVRPVVKGVILYPPDPNYNQKNLPYWDSIETVGIGAIPLLPSNDGYLRNYLAKILDPSNSNIYKPGLSFEPYETILKGNIDINE